MVGMSRGFATTFWGGGDGVWRSALCLSYFANDEDNHGRSIAFTVGFLTTFLGKKHCGLDMRDE